MKNNILTLTSMAKEELKRKILSFNLDDSEQKIFEKIVKSLDELYDLNNEQSKTKIAQDVATYMIYRQKGGKQIWKNKI